MARAVEQIERDIAALEKAVSAIAAELRNAYNNYLTALGQAVRRQLILASYHVCTQGYPEPFLSLSFSQRQQLQQAVQKLGQHASDQLGIYTRSEENLEGEREIDREGNEEKESRSNPMELAQWQQNLEQAIANTLKTASLETNRLLQQAEILPNKLPPPLLEAAANSSEASTETMAGPPNLLNLLIEAENNQESEDSTVINIVAVHLRLSEIEFTDATVRAGRNQIRNLEVRVRSLSREYYKKQRERAVAEAEAAWRASWFEEN